MICRERVLRIQEKIFVHAGMGWFKYRWFGGLASKVITLIGRRTGPRLFANPIGRRGLSACIKEINFIMFFKEK